MRLGNKHAQFYYKYFYSNEFLSLHYIAIEFDETNDRFE